MIADIIRDRGPMTVAAFMDLALYDPQYGYYARAARRSGRAGDFFTSVDVGPLFGQLLELQIGEMASILHTQFSVRHVDLVEAGAGDGRLAADILRALRRRDPAAFERVRLHLVEASPPARAAQGDVLRETFDRPFASSASLPDSFEGVLVANELLDAMPVHQVVMRKDGLREVYVAAHTAPQPGHPVLDTREHHGASASASVGAAPRELESIEGPPSTPALAAYLDRLGIALEPGWRVEINLRAVEWVRAAGRRLRRGFMMLVDYGHEARELYSEAHSGGTLTTFSRHTAAGADIGGSTPPWLRQPGERDITAHVDFTSVREAAEAEGLTTLGFLDQTYFVLGLLPHLEHPEQREHAVRPGNPGALQLKTLLMPGGLGSTMKVLILGKGVGRPALRGCSYRMRVT